MVPGMTGRTPGGGGRDGTMPPIWGDAGTGFDSVLSGAPIAGKRPGTKAILGDGRTTVLGGIAGIGGTLGSAEPVVGLGDEGLVDSESLDRSTSEEFFSSGLGLKGAGVSAGLAMDGEASSDGFGTSWFFLSSEPGLSEPLFIIFLPRPKNERPPDFSLFLFLLFSLFTSFDFSVASWDILSAASGFDESPSVCCLGSPGKRGAPSAPAALDGPEGPGVKAGGCPLAWPSGLGPDSTMAPVSGLGEGAPSPTPAGSLFSPVSLSASALGADFGASLPSGTFSVAESGSSPSGTSNPATFSASSPSAPSLAAPLRILPIFPRRKRRLLKLFGLAANCASASGSGSGGGGGGGVGGLGKPARGPAAIKLIGLPPSFGGWDGENGFSEGRP